MSDLATALFGAMKGGGKAVGQIAEDRRRDLAERMKLQLQNDLAMLRQKNDQNFRSGMQQSDQQFRSGLEKDKQTFQTGQQGALFEHQSNLSEQKLASDRSLAEERNNNLFNIAESRNKALVDASKNKADAKGDKATIDATKAEDAVWKDLVATKKWKPGDDIPKNYLDRINRYREMSGSPPVTVEQTKDKGFLEKVYGFFSDDANAGPAAPAPVDQSWKTTPTARQALNKPPSTAPVHKTDSQNLLDSPVKSAGVSLPDTSAPAQPRSSYTQAPTDEQKQAAVEEISTLVQKFGNNAKAVWDAMSSQYKALWGPYMAFGKWFNETVVGGLVNSQKQAYNETFRK